MKNIIFFLVAFFSTGVVYSQDSVKKNAVAQQGNVSVSHVNYIDKSKSDQSTKGIVSVNSTDTLPHQTTGDFRDTRRFIGGEKEDKAEPK